MTYNYNTLSIMGSDGSIKNGEYWAVVECSQRHNGQVVRRLPVLMDLPANHFDNGLDKTWRTFDGKTTRLDSAYRVHYENGVITPIPVAA